MERKLNTYMHNNVHFLSIINTIVVVITLDLRVRVNKKKEVDNA